MQQCNGFEALLFRKHRIQRLQVEEFKKINLKQLKGLSSALSSRVQSVAVAEPCAA